MELSLQNIENAIKKGATFLLNCINSDGGIQWKNHTTDNCSGIWTTAEALEFFLTSRVYTIECAKLKSLVEYIVKLQNENGYWAMLNIENSPASTITTGYCVYVLKLSMGHSCFNKELKNQIIEKIEKGETWLRNNCIKKQDQYFWCATPVTNFEISTLNNRIDCVYDTFYAVLGLTNPLIPVAISNDDKTYIEKATAFFRNQSNFFIDHYSANNQDNLNNVASTFCRLICLSDFLKNNNIIDKDHSAKLSPIIQKCCSNPFAMTELHIGTHTPNNEVTIHNNTPFDLAYALMSLHSNIDTIKKIVQKYIDKQDGGNFWYLEFNPIHNITTWTTTEALLVLERYYQTYQSLEKENKLNLLTKRVERYKGLSIISFVAIVLMIIVYYFGAYLGNIANFLYGLIGLIGSGITIYTFYKSNKKQ